MMTSRMATPATEYRKVSNEFFFIARKCLSAGPVPANDYPGGEERKNDDGQKENHIPRIQNALLEPLKMRHHAKRGNDLHQPLLEPQDLVEEISYRKKANHDQQEAQHQGNNKA